MSKTAKAKNRQPSIHSRAARRASSPSLNTDKSLKDISPAKSKNVHAHLFRAQDAGIRKKKNKQPKRGQLIRQRKGVERADVVKEQLGLKMQKSLAKLRTVKQRAKDWDAINGEVAASSDAAGLAGASKFAVLEGLIDEAGGVGADRDMHTETHGAVMQIPVRPLQKTSEVAASKSPEEKDWEDVVE